MRWVWREANRVLEERNSLHDLQVGLTRAWWEKGRDDKINEATSFGRPGIRVGRGEDDEEDEEEEDEAGDAGDGDGWTMASSTSLSLSPFSHSLIFVDGALSFSSFLIFSFFLHFHSTLV